MSEITSQSELTTKEIVEQAIQDYHMSILPYLAKGNNGYSETPIGAIQLFDDDTAPSGWLVADGTVYNIDDYPFLANHYERVHGSKNHYGGDGTTTFAVPDWRGEFFRASGPNAHPNQGSGAAVGEHQDGTETVNIVTNPTGLICHYGTGLLTNNIDSNISTGSTIYYSTVQTNKAEGVQKYTSRPTCTSGLCCIKAVPAGINYSLEEQEIGTDTDGKPVYQKTFNYPSTITISGNTIISDFIDVASLHIDKIKTIIGTCNYNSSNGPVFTLPLANARISQTSGIFFDNSTNKLVFEGYRGDSGSTNLYNIEVTVTYTKTTD